MRTRALFLALSFFAVPAWGAPNVPQAVQKQNLEHIQNEVKRLEASGWRLKDAPAVSDAVAPVEAASVETLHLPKRGPGRPPKPRAS